MSGLAAVLQQVAGLVTQVVRVRRVIRLPLVARHAEGLEVLVRAISAEGDGNNMVYHKPRVVWARSAAPTAEPIPLQDPRSLRGGHGTPVAWGRLPSATTRHFAHSEYTISAHTRIWRQHKRNRRASCADRGRGASEVFDHIGYSAIDLGEFGDVAVAVIAHRQFVEFGFPVLARENTKEFFGRQPACHLNANPPGHGRVALGLRLDAVIRSADCRAILSLISHAEVAVSAVNKSDETLTVRAAHFLPPRFFGICLNSGPGSSISKAMHSPSSTAADRQRHSPAASRYAAEMLIRPSDRFDSSYAVQPRSFSKSGTVSFIVPIWGIFPHLTRAGLFPNLGIPLMELDAMTATKKCPNCSGHGALHHSSTGTYLLPCRACRGSGQIPAKPRKRRMPVSPSQANTPKGAKS